jgi:hypothetical protein
MLNPKTFIYVNTSMSVLLWLQHIVISSQVLFHNGSLLHSEFNTQLLITVHNSSTHVHTLQTLAHNSTLLVILPCKRFLLHSVSIVMLLLCCDTNPLLSNRTVSLLWKCIKLIVVQQYQTRYYSNASTVTITLLWKCNMVHRSCYQGKPNMSQYVFLLSRYGLRANKCLLKIN